MSLGLTGLYHINGVIVTCLSNQETLVRSQQFLSFFFVRTYINVYSRNKGKEVFNMKDITKAFMKGCAIGAAWYAIEVACIFVFCKIFGIELD